MEWTVHLNSRSMIRRVGPKRTPGRRRAFTLVELMIVVVLVGILATVGIVSFRRWIFHTRSVEAIGMVQSIRVAQERWRSETGGYIDVSSSMTAWYPMTTPSRKLYDWKQVGGNDYGRWQLLNPTVSGPVQFGYVCRAGAPFTAMPDLETTDKPTWPVAAQLTQPWYVIQSMGDTDEDGLVSYYAAASLNGEIFKENEGE